MIWVHWAVSFECKFSMKVYVLQFTFGESLMKFQLNIWIDYKLLQANIKYY